MSSTPALPLDSVLDAATRRLAQGDLAGAEALLAGVRDASHPRLDYLSGLIALGRDDLAKARPLLARAQQALPADPGVQANWTVCLYRSGDCEAALAASDRAIALAPAHADNHLNRGLILFRLNRYAEAAQAFTRASEIAPNQPRAWLRLGETKHALGRFLEAEIAYRRALDLAPEDARLHAQVAAVLYDAGVFDKSLEHALRATVLDPELAAGWAAASAAQRRLGRLDEALASVDRALALDPDNGEIVKSRGLVLQMMDRLDAAAHEFVRAARIRFAPSPETPLQARELRRSSRAKLKHDIEQFDHLAARGVLPEAAALSRLHREALAALPPAPGDAQTVDLPSSLLERFAGRYNRLHHLAPAEAVPGGALDPRLDAAAIERDYFGRGPGITWIDGLLSPEALERLRRYCLESTFWFDFHHANGYLGAFFEDGFAAPLLLQIASELRAKFPAIFRDYPLTQLWAFKYDSRLDGIELHADIAAVNLNFWITPDSANLDPESGGLVVWDKEAPPHWGFDEYNTSTEAGQARIRRFLEQAGAQAVRVPYRQNRAVLFNSDLFHRTDTIRFAEGYENRRINITMLFGHRGGKVR